MAERDRRAEREEEDGGFLRRWSKRKAEARRAEHGPNEGAPRPGPEKDTATGEAGGGGGPERTGDLEPIDPRDLPDIDSLHQGSDFKAFMRPGVPPELRTRALRRLWRVDPRFSKLDGLVEYGDDYTIKKHPPGAIKTAYQVSRGFVNRIDQAQVAEPERPDAPEAGEPVRPTGEPAGPAPEGASGEPESAERADRGCAAAQDTRADASGAALKEEPAAASERPRRRPLPRRG